MASHGGDVHKIAICDAGGFKCADINENTSWGETAYWLSVSTN